jgi:hypothetical protein
MHPKHSTKYCQTICSILDGWALSGSRHEISNATCRLSASDRCRGQLRHSFSLISVQVELLLCRAYIKIKIWPSKRSRWYSSTMMYAHHVCFQFVPFGQTDSVTHFVCCHGLSVVIIGSTLSNGCSDSTIRCINACMFCSIDQFTPLPFFRLKSGFPHCIFFLFIYK